MAQPQLPRMQDQTPGQPQLPRMQDRTLAQPVTRVDQQRPRQRQVMDLPPQSRRTPVPATIACVRWTSSAPTETFAMGWSGALTVIALVREWHLGVTTTTHAQRTIAIMTQTNASTSHRRHVADATMDSMCTSEATRSMVPPMKRMLVTTTIKKWSRDTATMTTTTTMATVTTTITLVRGGCCLSLFPVHFCCFVLSMRRWRRRQATSRSTFLMDTNLFRRPVLGVASVIMSTSSIKFVQSTISEGKDRGGRRDMRSRLVVNQNIHCSTSNHAGFMPSGHVAARPLLNTTFSAL